MAYLLLFDSRSIDLFDLFERSTLRLIDGARARFFADEGSGAWDEEEEEEEGEAGHGRWARRAAVVALFGAGWLLAPQLVLGVCSLGFVHANMWVCCAFFTAMLGAMDQDHATLRSTILPPGDLRPSSLRRQSSG